MTLCWKSHFYPRLLTKWLNGTFGIVITLMETFDKVMPLVVFDQLYCFRQRFFWWSDHSPNILLFIFLSETLNSIEFDLKMFSFCSFVYFLFMTYFAKNKWPNLCITLMDIVCKSDAEKFAFEPWTYIFLSSLKNKLFSATK